MAIAYSAEAEFLASYGGISKCLKLTNDLVQIENDKSSSKFQDRQKERK